MFVDSVDIFVSSGRGGAGAVSFRREKFVIQGGPDGGDGGDGGDVFIEADTNCDTLSNFRGKKHYRAQNGKQGEGKNKSGRMGEDIIIKLPLGTQIIDFESGELLCDFAKNERILLLKGGKGGLGNARFKNAINQKPTYAQKGLEGTSRHLRLELKIIADVGLVGFPNVGKSTLLSVLSHAKPQIADYEFTTLIPNLGVVGAGELHSFVMADIPGIINGASLGRGLGIAFLRHIERTRLFLFMLDSTKPLLGQFHALVREIAAFDKSLCARRFGIALTKIDCGNFEENLAELLGHFGISWGGGGLPKDSQDSQERDSLGLADSQDLPEQDSRLLQTAQDSAFSPPPPDSLDSMDSHPPAPKSDFFYEKFAPQDSPQRLRGVAQTPQAPQMPQTPQPSPLNPSPAQKDSLKAPQDSPFSSPLFIIPISALRRTNVEKLRFLLFKYLEKGLP